MKAAQSRRIRLPTVGESHRTQAAVSPPASMATSLQVGSATAPLGTAGAAALEASGDHGGRLSGEATPSSSWYAIAIRRLLAITDRFAPKPPRRFPLRPNPTGAKPGATGDNQATADRLGVQVGIDDVMAGLRLTI